MPMARVPQSKLRPRAFECLRRTEAGERLWITDHGHPVADVVPHGADDGTLRALRGLVVRYECPKEPLAVAWEADA